MPSSCAEFGGRRLGRVLDDCHADHPDSISGFSTFPDLLLGELREVQGRLARTRGGLRRAAGPDMTLILSNCITMVTMSGLPVEVDGK